MPHPRRATPTIAGGEVGEIFTRSSCAPANYSYLGAKPIETVDGDFASVGDLGYVDADGYLFLADRRVDQVITGGANVVPAEVEAVLTQHPGVRDPAVIGLKDDDLGRRVHALIEPANADAPPALEELDAHLRVHLASYKLPRGYEIVAMLRAMRRGRFGGASCGLSVEDSASVLRGSWGRIALVQRCRVGVPFWLCRAALLLEPAFQSGRPPPVAFSARCLRRAPFPLR